MVNKTPYYKQYTKIKPEVITAVKSLIDSGFFKESKENKLNMIKLLHTTLCSIYSIPIIEIEFKEGNKLANIFLQGNGCFDQRENKIVLFRKVSLVTYLHEFKHYLQFIRKKELNEKVARGWSLSLFYLADKKAFKRAVKKGYILHCERYEEEE